MAFLIRHLTNQIKPALVQAIVFCLLIPNITLSADREQTLKTAYIYQISRFIDWPTSNSSNFTICIVSNDSFLHVANAFFRSKRIHQQPVVVQASKNNNCQVIFIDSSVSHEKPPQRKGVLTISDQKDFSMHSGAIELHIVQNKLRFSINNDIAQHNGLRIRPQLLSLAQKVYSGEKQP